MHPTIKTILVKLTPPRIVTRYLYRLILFIPNFIMFAFVIALRISFNVNAIANHRKFMNYCLWVDDKCDLYDSTLEV